MKDISFDFSGRKVAVTGGAGVLGADLVRALVQHGADVAVMDLNMPAASELCNSLKQSPGSAMAIETNVLDRENLQQSFQVALNHYGHIDILINGAGGNSPKATVRPDLSFFDIPADGLDFVFNLNLMGTILPSQILGRHFAERGEGLILNISSMNAFRPLTNIAAYSAAKAGVSNFTQWLAVHMAKNYTAKIRVNAIAPGFFFTKQNEFLLKDAGTGELTPRARTIIEHIPQGKFGEASQLIGPSLWLLSSAAEYVTGIVLPVDGGFSAFSGV